MSQSDKKRKLIITSASALISYISVAKNKYNKKRKRLWQKKWLREREKYSDVKLLKELRASNEHDDYQNYLRMSSNTFDDLLRRLEPYLNKQDTVMRNSIPPNERLVATLRFLATGRSYEDLKFSTGISPQALGYIIPETCRVIYEVLQPEFLQVSGYRTIHLLFIYETFINNSQYCLIQNILLHDEITKNIVEFIHYQGFAKL